MKTLIAVIILVVVTINGMKNAKEFMTDVRINHEQRIELAASGRLQWMLMASFCSCWSNGIH